MILWHGSENIITKKYDDKTIVKDIQKKIDAGNVNGRYIISLIKNDISVYSAHPGYVQCAHASFAGSVLSSERDEINSYLNSGFYYE